MADDFSKAKVGDKVYSLLHGWVEIMEFNPAHTYPVITAQVSFTYEGKCLRAGGQVLFWGEPSIVAPPMPPRKVKRWIVGRYDENLKVFLAGSDMTPRLYESKEAAEADTYLNFPTAFIVEVEILEQS